jgi:hypothetical protein
VQLHSAARLVALPGGCVRLRLPWLIVVCALLFARPAAATSLSVVAAADPVTVGDTFVVNIAIADVTDLFAWQFDFAFDPTLLRAESVVEGDFLSSGGLNFIPGDISVDTANAQTGSILFIANALNFDESVTGGGILATIGFTSLAAGTSTLDLLNVFLLDSANLAPIASDVNGGSIESIGTVPEPGTLMLAAAGLAAVWRARRRGIV